MKNNEKPYSGFSICSEMMETPRIIREFDWTSIQTFVDLFKDAEGLILTGEGSSRIFPAKRGRAQSLYSPVNTMIPITEGSRQAREYNLDKYAVLGASNSGRTKELISLFTSLRQSGHTQLAGICANSGTPLESLAHATLILGCGPENAVAATKSVVEQALVIHALVSSYQGVQLPDMKEGADAFKKALEIPVPKEISQALAQARVIYFSGRNDGVAEELTLKTNEIVRKPSDYLEGTYAAHGIEEVMHKDDVVILIDPFEEEEEKLEQCLQTNVGVKIFAIADRQTRFPTLLIPSTHSWKEYILIAGGWNLLVEAGLVAGINMDTTVRARKVGNEVNRTLN